MDRQVVLVTGASRGIGLWTVRHLLRACRVVALSRSRTPELEALAQAQPDDESADALRAAAPESRAEILEPVPVPD